MSVVGQQLINAIRAKAAEKPDFIYCPLDGTSAWGTCVYVKDGEPSCIVGHGLWDLGLIDASMEGSTRNDEPVHELVNALGLELDLEELQWLRNVQNKQDVQNTWADSVLEADKAGLESILIGGIG